MRFITDSMLGSLTRWLRLLGHDAKYLRDCDDQLLIEEASRERRILLTKDVELFKHARKKGLEAMLIKVRDKAEMLAQLANRYKLNLEIDPILSKCPTCGSSIKDVSKESVNDKVPISTLKIQNRFWMCTNNECGKIYWYGSHWEKIKKVLSRANVIAGRLSECQNQN
jgi:uncharacterized protein with PIN domain